MNKQYTPKDHEDKIYLKWEKSGYFNPDNLDCPKDAPTYTITLPPPNITAKLHLGHSSMLAIEDLLIRFHRMQGYRTLWVPGTDHAAIATQNAVEKKLLKETGKTRHDLGRDKFLKEVWIFLKQTQSTILNQTKKMGASLDWSRQAFTLDEKRQKAVAKMFVDMYNKGVIYRGERIVNWCPRCKSTLADDEVEHKHQTAPLYTFKYSSDFPIAISTTRPETKLADTAVAVNPKDTRYKKYIGKTFDANFVGIPLKIKIIADRNVDMNFGTGALGVTPAHSITDWQIGQDNKLNIIKAINEDGKIKDKFDKYSGLSTKKARELIVKNLKKANLIEKEDEIENNLSICYRCDTAIEPLPSKQWFVSVDKKLKKLGNKSLKEKAIEVAELEQINFIPNRFKKRYLDWMNNLHDWCISRQIWFGHQIPVYYNKSKVESRKSKVNEKNIYVGINPPEGDGWVQDPDTLDTWFSSGMWTFSTLSWPDTFDKNKKQGDLARYHPTQVLETGYEIITLWVSRMIMMSLFALGEIPFENVYLHGMVLDKHGKKMSKSKGNGIDPIDVIEQFGTDAVRLSLLIGNTPGNDLRLGEEKIASFRNFANKLWNISRYIITNYELRITNYEISDKNLTTADIWILSKLDNIIREVTDDLKNYEFSAAGEKLKDFAWNDLADWYLEVSKFEDNTDEKNKILNLILETILKLWHPFMPFVTEVIWGNLGKDKLLMVSEWPKISQKLKVESQKSEFDIVKLIIIGIRNARAKNKIEPSKKIEAVIFAGEKQKLIQENAELIKKLRTGIEKIEVKQKGDKIENAIYITVKKIDIYLIGGRDAKKEQERIKKEIENLEKLIKNQKQKLGNKKFVEKAPANIVKKEQEKLKGWEEEYEKLKTLI